MLGKKILGFASRSAPSLKPLISTQFLSRDPCRESHWQKSQGVLFPELKIPDFYPIPTRGSVQAIPLIESPMKFSFQSLKSLISPNSYQRECHSYKPQGLWNNKPHPSPYESKEILTNANVCKTIPTFTGGFGLDEINGKDSSMTSMEKTELCQRFCAPSSMESDWKRTWITEETQICLKVWRIWKFCFNSNRIINSLQKCHII